MEKIGKKTKSEEKQFLSALEQEKLTELGKKQQRYKDVCEQIGDLSITLKLIENEALQLRSDIFNSDNSLVFELKNKYGNFTVGENFEVIKTEQNEK